MDKGRRKPDKNEDSPLVQAAKEEVLPGYEEYLVLLQERNRLLKRLRKKSKKDIEQERREQGFSLYVNGPHKDGRHPSSQHSTGPTQPAPKTARKPKTAGERPRNNTVLDNQALEQITRDEIERQREMARAKTAPSAHERRRNWTVDSSVEIKTTRGGEKLKAPDILSGKYADDFESGDDSDELRSSASENSDNEAISPVKYRKPARKPPPPRESDMFNSSDSINSEDDDMDSDGDDLVIDAANFSKNSNSSPRKSQKSRSRGNHSDDDGPSEKLMLSMRELRTLRQSLVKNATIRESLARDKNADEDFIPESPIQEVEEDIPSDEEYIDSPGRKINLNNKPKMKPDDTIVLEFGGGQLDPRKKVEKNLSAARKKDIDKSEYISSGRMGSGRNDKQSQYATNRSQSTKTLGSENVGKKSVRPLSASRRTPDRVSTDPDNEASAVLAALKAENEQASKIKQMPKPKVSSQSKITSQSRSETRPKPPRPSMDTETSASSMALSQNEPLVPYDKINQIMEKVLRMSPRHQRRLVSMLGKIEKTIVTESTESIPASNSSSSTRSSNNGRIGSSQDSRRSSNNGPMKAVHRSSISKKSTSSSGGDYIEIHIEIKSNWGHAMRLGLTEIQIYDQSNHLLSITGDDVSIHGAEECQGSVDTLFNGKFKTNKERNMWSCRYHARRPIEIIINVRNPKPGTNFSLSQMKIWNFNKSINDLDIGIKDVKVFVGTDLVFTGPVEKGCGNQVFDYCQVIPLVSQVAHSTETNPEIEVERSPTPEKVVVKKQQIVSSSSADKISRKKALDERKNNMAKSKSRDSLDVSVDKSQRRPPVSPRERSPSPAPKFPVNKSPREPPSNNHRSISPRPSQERKKTFRSISMSSQSSAESGGESNPNSRPTSGVRTPQNRSETRTINHPVKLVPYRSNSQGSESLSESEGRTFVYVNFKPLWLASWLAWWLGGLASDLPILLVKQF
ncbi:hypothetical protein ACF0H5_000256 [Mactra antiquata]